MVKSKEKDQILVNNIQNNGDNGRRLQSVIAKWEKKLSKEKERFKKRLLNMELKKAVLLSTKKGYILKKWSTTDKSESDRHDVIRVKLYKSFIINVD